MTPSEKNCANDPFSKTCANDPFSKNCANDLFRKKALQEQVPVQEEGLYQVMHQEDDDMGKKELNQMKQEERMRSELEDQLGMLEQQKEQCKATNIHRGLHERRRRETKYATRKEGAFMEKVTRRELLSQGNPKSSSQTSFSVQNVSSMQRMLVHIDTQV